MPRDETNFEYAKSRSPIVLHDDLVVRGLKSILSPRGRVVTHSSSPQNNPPQVRYPSSTGEGCGLPPHEMTGIRCVSTKLPRTRTHRQLGPTLKTASDIREMTPLWHKALPDYRCLFFFCPQVTVRNTTIPVPYLLYASLCMYVSYILCPIYFEFVLQLWYL